ncbi:MAG: hypothetical protein ACYS8X_08295 [Planctomycetota bacterium]|jgi:hypothetical protein
MMTESVSDCRFKGQCKTFSSPLIGTRQKGPAGMGCLEQTDEYRRHSCRHFVCAYLAVSITEQLAPEPASEQPVP